MDRNSRNQHFYTKIRGQKQKKSSVMLFLSSAPYHPIAFRALIPHANKAFSGFFIAPYHRAPVFKFRGTKNNFRGIKAAHLFFSSLISMSSTTASESAPALVSCAWLKDNLNNPKVKILDSSWSVQNSDHLCCAFFLMYSNARWIQIGAILHNGMYLT
jgi:hypothetical protein